jgi:hypothetical protein
VVTYDNPVPYSGSARCFVCGTYDPELTHDGIVVCTPCYEARGGWEDARLDQYGRIVS